MEKPIVKLTNNDTVLSLFFKVEKYLSNDDIKEWIKTNFISEKLAIAERYVELDTNF